MENPIPNGRAARKATLASRLRRVRLERYGEHGGPELARALGVPFRTWANYEAGVTIPGEVLLAFLAATRVEPAWLLDGEGPAYRDRPE
jgi:transcriptional regulator with XRE-family HTH domain